MVTGSLATEATLLAAQYYDDLGSYLDLDYFQAQPAVDDTLEDRLKASVRFALLEEATSSFLERTGIRAIHDSARNTLIENVDREQGKWLRIPGPNACGFCRMLGTRGPVYHSEHAACASHDGCKCEVHVQRPGMPVIAQPDYMRPWHGEYEAARRQVRLEGKRTTMDNIVRQWNKDIRAAGNTDYLHEVA